jgi:Protein of unknown function (DUF4054)
VGSSPPVTFNFATFVATFPEFSALTSGQAQGYFNRATGSIVGNSTTNPIFNDGNLPYLVYLVTAHVAWLNCPKDANGNPAATGAPASPLVGRISNASEGSVSVQTEWPLDGSSSAQEKYLAQTKYGVEYWAATSQYRTAQYAARPTIVVGGRFRNPWLGRGGWWG